jgi:thymidylate synthase (FAD)
MVAAYEANLKCDVARELARIDLPLSIYTYAYWKIDLHNLLRFLKLRLDEHAQWEIRKYAQVIAGVVKELWPITWKAFSDYTLNSVKFSFAEQHMLCYILSNKLLHYRNITRDYISNLCYHQGIHMSNAEIDDFIKKLHNMDDLDKNDCTLDISKAKTAEYFKNMVENA